MCNPQSSFAYRRYRSSQHAAATSKASAMLTKNLLGSMFMNSGVPASAPTATIPTSAMVKEVVPRTTSTALPPYHQHYFADPTVPTQLSAFQQQLRTNNEPQLTKPKPKRRRKPQKPGKTAKLNDRHFVVHNYHDHANDTDDGECDESNKRRGGVSVSFPLKLHQVLEQVESDGLGHVVSWQPHGRCFVIHKPKEFTDHIMPHYFRQTKLTSFQRQLNLYGFQRLTRGADSGGYYHELFLRGKEFLVKHMVRTKVKGTKFKAASSPEQEPDFYTMAPVVAPITPSTSDCDNSDDGHCRSNPRYSVPVPPPKLAPISREVDYYPSMTYRPLVSPQFPSDIVNPIPYKPYAEPTSMEEPPMPPAAAVAQTSAQFCSPARLAKASSSSVLGKDFLDDAVDDLFLGDTQSNDSILDFVSAWDIGAADAALTNDVQLGNLLDRLLEE